MHAHTHTHIHTHRVVHQCNGTEEKAFKKRKVFKEDLKELTELYALPLGQTSSHTLVR